MGWNMDTAYLQLKNNHSRASDVKHTVEALGLDVESQEAIIESMSTRVIG
jgi:hypothetical protein